MTPRTKSPISSDLPLHRIQKRTTKACDRCRMKKSKCNGIRPCSRCRADNSICTFGQGCKVSTKIYPKGYVEMLEEQQSWLAHGLRVLYRQVCDGESRQRGSAECIETDQPTILNLLARLGFLNPTQSHLFEETEDPAQKSMWKRHEEVLQYLDVSDNHTDTIASQRRTSTSKNASPSSDETQSSMTSNAFVMPSCSEVEDTMNAMIMPNSVDWANDEFGAWDEAGILSGGSWAHALFNLQIHSPTMEEIPPMEWATANLVGEGGDYGDIWQFDDAGTESTLDL